MAADVVEAPTTLIATRGDHAYFPFIKELRRSIVAAFLTGAPGLAVINAGLLPDQAAHLAAAGVTVVRLPEDPALPATALQKRPVLAANVVRSAVFRI